MGRQLRALMISPLLRQRLTMFVCAHRPADLDTLRRLAEAGRVTPVVSRTYSLAEAPQAIRHLHAGHARGKLAITI
jgi:NADPH:quinone reductase-like Zn-dependent oxidoreductase